MKKITALLVALLMILPMLVQPAAAALDSGSVDNVDNVATDGDSNTNANPEFSEEELEGILTPESRWYFLKRFFESVKEVLTFDSEKKADLLAQLTEERAKELQALEQKYSEGELSDKELATLEKALESLIAYTEKYIEHLASTLEGDVEDEDPQDSQGDDEEIDEDNVEYSDKYQQRIAHLQRIAAGAPEAAQKGLSRAIANAQRQRARMIVRGKVTEELLSSFIKFELKIESSQQKLSLKFEQKSDGIKAEVKVEQDGMEIKKKDAVALNYILPILETLEIDASLSQAQMTNELLSAFGWEGNYDELEAKIEFADGATFEIKSRPVYTNLGLSYVKFELKIKAEKDELEVKFEQKSDEVKAEIEIKQAGIETKLKKSAAINYLLPILEDLEISKSMSRTQVIDSLLAAFGWEGDFKELEAKIELTDGTKIEFQSKETPVETGLPFKKFEFKIKENSNQLSVKFEQKSDEHKAEVEIKQDGRESKLKNTAAINYLLPILETLNLDPSMPRAQVIEKLLTAFKWEGGYDELEVKIDFINRGKIEFKSKGTELKTALPYVKFELEIESDDGEMEVEFEQSRDGAKAEVKIKKKGSREIELKGSAALNYLLPILENLSVNASMTRRQIVNAVLTAFNWSGDFEEFELEIKFADGTKIDIEID